jgi:hypothetical protein
MELLQPPTVNGGYWSGCCHRSLMLSHNEVLCGSAAECCFWVRCAPGRSRQLGQRSAHGDPAAAKPHCTRILHGELSLTSAAVAPALGRSCFPRRQRLPPRKVTPHSFTHWPTSAAKPTADTVLMASKKASPSAESAAGPTRACAPRHRRRRESRRATHKEKGIH